MLRAGLEKQLPHHFKDTLRIAGARLFNLQSKKRAWIVGKEHYDLGNDLFSRMLDPYMQYSCGYWKEAQSLEAAQQAKLDLICRKLELEPGMRVLDIGCGWGGLAEYMARNYQVSVVNVDPWIDKYIFPNGCLPSVRHIAEASEKHFVMEDWHNFGADYDTTLMAWYERFLASWPEIADNYSERFKRMFTYYLNACAGAFRARDIQLWQVVFSRGIEHGLRVAR